MYHPIRVSTLRGDQKISFPVYVKVAEKYILYLREGDSFEGQRLKRLKEKKLKRLYILPEHEDKYRAYLQSNIEAAYDMSSNKTLEQRAEIVQGDQQSRAEELMDNPADSFAYEQVKSGVEKFFTLLGQEQSLVKQILSMENMDSSVAHHGVNVATLLQALLRKKKATFDEKTQSLMGVAALIHDLEHFHSGIDLKRPRASMSKEEYAEYVKHPQQGADRLRDKKHFDSLVIKIIEQHEETEDAKGFPMGLAENKIAREALLVGLCNYADRMISFEGTPREEASRALLVSGVGKYPLEDLKLVSEVLKEISS